MLGLGLDWGGGGGEVGGRYHSDGAVPGARAECIF